MQGFLGILCFMRMKSIILYLFYLSLCFYFFALGVFSWNNELGN